MKDKILVTGGLGYIGSHTTVSLLENKYDVVIIDDLSNSRAWMLDRIETITGSRPVFYSYNMCREELLRDVFEKEKTIRGVIHFAASKSVAESVREPLKYFRNNLVPLINLLECMEEYAAPHIIFSSSATVYGQPDQLPAAESTPFKKALSAYGSTKQFGEDILEKTCAAKNITCTSLRYFNPAGAHESALIGELPLGIPNNLMPYITQVAAGKIPALTVFGNDYKTPDGTCLRDYIHVCDLATAHVKSLQRLLAGKQSAAYEAFNIGTGKPVSVLELITAFETCNKVKLPYHTGPRRPGDAESIYAAVDAAQQQLDWKAERDIHDIVTSAWQWQKRLEE